MSLARLLFSRSLLMPAVDSFNEFFGAEGRGAYYDAAGHIRDVIQNRELLCLALPSYRRAFNLLVSTDQT